MEQPKQTESSATQSSGTERHKEGRNVWVLTVYGILGLAVFGVMAYFFSRYIAN